ncbi:unnamed protein product [Symbiodinium necroappetens]|uniref:Uncharacterized protein n=1 Tax=Symbiodinium necroappetens TaxID=1628268 RepID=A0A812Q4S4_9DINO|nr:unnamed protein product [Symbiodinium necroappetens]
MAGTELRIGSQPALYPSHPLAPTYLRRDLPAVDVRNLWRLRDEGNCPLPNSKSATSSSFSASKHSVEFASVSSFRDTLRKHTRSPCSPSQKYKYGSATAHEIGWFIDESPTQKIGLRRPKHGLKESETTRYYNNMKATLSEAQQLFAPFGHLPLHETSEAAPAAPSAGPAKKSGIPSLPGGSSSMSGTHSLGLGGDALFNSKGSWKEGHGSHPNSGRRPSGFGSGKENAGGSKGFNLPPLGASMAPMDGRKSSGTGKKSPGARYLKMARYQPGMPQQMSSLPAVRPSMPPGAGVPGVAGVPSAGNARPDALPEVGGGPPRQSYFGAHAARMLG